MKRLKRILACGLLQAALLSTGCGPEEGAGAEPPPAPPAPVEEPGNAGRLVSPELFDVAARWSAESLGTGGVSAASRTGGDLLSYVGRHAPGLLDEATQALAHTAPEQRGALADACACQLWGTFDKPGASKVGSGWNLDFRGAAHSGRIYQNLSGTKREQMTDSPTYTTQFRMRMNCATPAGAACSAGCTAKLYADVQYASQIDTAADTGGIWNKGSTAQVVDGATLDFRTPFGGAGTRLFEKAAAISHYATTTTFNVDELANLLKSALSIYTVIKTGDINLITSELIDQTLKAIFGLIHRSGTDGVTSRGLIAHFESPFWEPIPVTYASANNLYYALDLATHVRMKTRGWGGWHKAEGKVASSASIVTYVDNFVCDAGVTPPGRTGFWRYDAFDGAPLPTAALQDRVRNFLYSGFGRWFDVSGAEGTVR
jgi:hypothetical protein